MTLTIFLLSVAIALAFILYVILVGNGPVKPLPMEKYCVNCGGPLDFKREERSFYNKFDPVAGTPLPKQYVESRSCPRCGTMRYSYD